MTIFWHVIRVSSRTVNECDKYPQPAMTNWPEQKLSSITTLGGEYFFWFSLKSLQYIRKSSSRKRNTKHTPLRATVKKKWAKLFSWQLSHFSIETISMSGNIIGFGWEIRKLAFWKHTILDLICCPVIYQYKICASGILTMAS